MRGKRDDWDSPTLEGANGADRIGGTRSSQVDDHERGAGEPDGVFDAATVPHEYHAPPRSFRSGSNPRSKEQVIDDGHDHGKMISKKMRVFSAAVPPFMKNGFVVACDESPDAVIIDPGDEVEALLAAIDGHGLTVASILLTHAHVDHITGVGRAKAALGASVWLHRDDLLLYEGAVDQGRLFGLRVDAPPPVDRFYDLSGAPIRCGFCVVDVRHTPGHSPGGVCLAVGRRGTPDRDLFVGDTLFAGSIGRTDLPGGDYDTLLRSIRTVLFTFPDGTVVHAGHGPDTTIGDERRSNPFLVR
jgi:hydroxyacylglutathione hydrolase